MSTMEDDMYDGRSLSLEEMSEDYLRQLFGHLQRTRPEVLAEAMGELGVKDDDSEPEQSPEPSSAATVPPEPTPKLLSPLPGPVDEVVEDDGVDVDSEDAQEESDKEASLGESCSGCYLVYDADHSKLMLYYSRVKVVGAVGLFRPGPGHHIQKFKFDNKNFGKFDLIKNCGERKNYYSGFCQFIRAARALEGDVIFFNLDIDLFLHYKNGKNGDINKETIKVEPGQRFQTSDIDAVACLPKHSEFWDGVSNVSLSRWITEASAIGSTTIFEDNEPAKDMKDPVFMAYSRPTLSARQASCTMTLEEKKELKEKKRNVAKGAKFNSIKAPPKSQTPPPPDETSPDSGCYLVYDPDSSGRLMLYYSHSPVSNSIGYWKPAHDKPIQGFKFKRNFGRSELIGNIASGGITGRKKYYSGWCQFIRSAKALNGAVLLRSRNDGTANRPGLDVDIFFFYKFGYGPEQIQTIKMPEDVLFDVSEINAVACLPKHAEFFDHSLKVDMNRWLTEANTIGAASRFEEVMR